MNYFANPLKRRRPLDSEIQERTQNGNVSRPVAIGVVRDLILVEGDKFKTPDGASQPRAEFCCTLILTYLQYVMYSSFASANYFYVRLILQISSILRS